METFSKLMRCVVSKMTRFAFTYAGMFKSVFREHGPDVVHTFIFDNQSDRQEMLRDKGNGVVMCRFTRESVPFEDSPVADPRLLPDWFVKGRDFAMIEVVKDTRNMYVDVLSKDEFDQIPDELEPRTISIPSVGESIKSCVQCGKQSTLRCSSCKVAYYCSKDCQKENWRLHKAACREIEGRNT